MFANVLVTIDGSDISRAALPLAARASQAGGKVTVVQVVDDASRILARTTPAGFEFGAGAMNVRLADEVIEAQRTAAHEHLDAAAAELRGAGVEDVTTEILAGLPGEQIVEFARERGCDLVVMATHGRSGLRRTVLGSVAEYVLRHLEAVPVLMVHPTED